MWIHEVLPNQAAQTFSTYYLRTSALSALFENLNSLKTENTRDKSLITSLNAKYAQNESCLF